MECMVSAQAHRRAIEYYKIAQSSNNVAVKCVIYLSNDGAMDSASQSSVRLVHAASVDHDHAHMDNESDTIDRHTPSSSWHIKCYMCK